MSEQAHHDRATGRGPEPAGSPPTGPRHALLLGTVARRFYLEGATKVQIADQLGLSRFKVARLLEEALAGGLVRIEVGAPGGLDTDLSTRLAARLGLRDCLVVDTAGRSVPEARRQLGRTSADYLAEVITVDDVLGLPWSREVYAMVQALTSLPPVEVVQLCGAQQLPDDDASAVEVVVQAARLAGGRGHVFYAPLIVDGDEAARAVRRQPTVADALAQARRVTRAVVGIGHWAPGTSSIYDAVTPPVREAVRAQGVVGEIAGVFFDADGAAVTPPLARCVVGLSDARLRAIPRVCAVVLGAAKAPAVRAAVAGRLVDSLIIDSALGEALLDS